MQRAYHRILDRKCALMCMDAFRATENVFKEREAPPKTVRTPENVGQVSVSIQTALAYYAPVRLVCENDPTILLHDPIILSAFQERDLDNVWLQQDGATAHTSSTSMGVLRATLPE
ncbi:hypothetical protein TNCV_753851 [Trichonephila clavipes]|nr:hypothetical protein TNCV_753851 [Trichonephila clavipes]